MFPALTLEQSPAALTRDERKRVHYSRLQFSQYVHVYIYIYIYVSLSLSIYIYIYIYIYVDIETMYGVTLKLQSKHGPLSLLAALAASSRLSVGLLAPRERRAISAVHR